MAWDHIDATQVSQRCHFDPDCMKQQKFIDAGKGKDAADQCDAGVDGCDPLIVGGYEGGFIMPAPLFGSDAGTTEFGPGKLTHLWASSAAKVTVRNTGCLLEVLNAFRATFRNLDLLSAY